MKLPRQPDAPHGVKAMVIYFTMSGRNALFSMSALDGIIRSYVNATSLFSIIAFGSCFHEFSATAILILGTHSLSQFQDVCNN